MQDALSGLFSGVAFDGECGHWERAYELLVSKKCARFPSYSHEVDVKRKLVAFLLTTSHLDISPDTTSQKHYEFVGTMSLLSSSYSCSVFILQVAVEVIDRLNLHPRYRLHSRGVRFCLRNNWTRVPPASAVKILRKRANRNPDQLSNVAGRRAP